jgi:hypothetical protein
MKIHVEVGVFVRVARGAAPRHRLGHRAQPLGVGIGGAHRRKAGGHAFESVAQLEHVVDRRRMPLQQVHQRVGDGRPGHVGDAEAAAAPRLNQAAAFQHQQAFAQRRARHAQAHGQLALRRQRVARLQLAADDQALDLFRDAVRQALPARRGDGAETVIGFHRSPPG